MILLSVSVDNLGALLFFIIFLLCPFQGEGNGLPPQLLLFLFSILLCIFYILVFLLVVILLCPFQREGDGLPQQLLLFFLMFKANTGIQSFPGFT